MRSTLRRAVRMTWMISMGTLTACSSGTAAGVQAATFSPPAPTADAGGIVIRFSRLVEDVTILVDGQIYFEEQNLRRAQLAAVPPGEREVRVVVASAFIEETIDRTFTMNVQPGQEALEVIAVGAMNSAGQWLTILAGAMIVLSILAI